MRVLELLGFILVLSLAGGMSAQGQVRDDFRPVTQEMLNNPDPADWLYVASNLQRLGIQSAGSDQP